MPKHELSKDNNNGYAKGDRMKITKSQPYTEELQATKECWQWEEQSSLGKSTAIILLASNSLKTYIQILLYTLSRI